MKVTHELGETTVTKNPKTVVVFDMGTLDTLDQLGIEVAAVPHDGLPSYLSKYESTTANAGGLKEPDFEAISELAPDLILISDSSSRSLRSIKRNCTDCICRD